MTVTDRIREAITSATDDPALIFALVAIAEAIQENAEAVRENTEVQRELADASLRAAENFFRLGMGELDDGN